MREVASRVAEQPRVPWSLGVPPAGGLLAGLRHVSMPRFLTVAVPLTAVFVLGFVLEYRAREGSERARFFAQESAVLERGVRGVERELEVARGDLLLAADLLASSPEDAAPEAHTALERSLLALARRRPGILGIRQLDVAGREVLRVESGSSGPRIVSERAAPGAADREAFAGASGLAGGEVFVSRMELAVERGAIVTPHTPVVRLATPIESAAGRRRGVVVLDVRGAQFLRAFPRNDDAAGVQRMIVDSDGYWLQHRPEVEWGFQLPHGIGFQRTFPEVWAQLAGNPHGPVETGDGLFYFASVSPQAPGAARGAPPQQQGSWWLVSLVPREVLHGITVRVGTRLLVVAMPLYFGLLGIAWLLAAALERRRAADDALRNLEYVRSSMMRAALDAIIVMDKHGTTLEFNPAAQEIFGYTLEEARGRLVADLIIPPADREAHRAGLERYLATGEGPLIDRHVSGLTAIRKGGAELPVELTICPMRVAGKRLFCGFLRDLGEPGEAPASPAREADIL